MTTEQALAKFNAAHNDVKPERRFGIYVQGPARSGYLAKLPGLTPWQSDARRFETLADANAEITARGWTLDTSVRAGTVTAYACHLL